MINLMELGRFMCQIVTKDLHVDSLALARLAVNCPVPGANSRRCRTAIQAAKGPGNTLQPINHLMVGLGYDGIVNLADDSFVNGSVKFLVRRLFSRKDVGKEHRLCRNP